MGRLIKCQAKNCRNGGKVDTNEVFENAVDCVKFYKEKHNIEFDKKMISYILKHNPKKDINGYHFEYAKEDGYGS